MPPASSLNPQPFLPMLNGPSLGYLNPVLKILLALGFGLAICALL
jgi:hypothetical protein